MRQIAGLLTDRKFVTGSSVLALALGMGAAPAHATLVITPLDETLSSKGTHISFGPSWDPNGFTAYVTPGPSILDPTSAFDLIGNTSVAGTNGVADLPVDMGCTSPSNSCKLETFNPGGQVDSTANFQTAGEFKTFDPPITPSNGNYYFGLDDVNPVDPYGWLEITLNDGSVTLDDIGFQTNGGPASIPSVPEPGALSLFAVGAAALLARRRKKSRAPAS